MTLTAPVAFAMPTLLPTPSLPSPATPSPIPLPPLTAGDIILSDGFDDLLAWEFAPKGIGDLSIVQGRLSIAVRVTGRVLVALNSAEPPSDFFAEVTARPELCQPQDEYGLVFRAGGYGEHYRFTLNCDGESRLVRLSSGSESALVPFEETYAILPGVGQDNRLAVLAQEDSFLLVLNGEPVFTVRDPTHRSGRIGLVVHSRTGLQTTVTFEDLVVRSLPMTPAPSAAPSATREP